MAETENNYLTNEPVESRIDLKSVIGQVMRFWYVFLLFIAAALAFAIAFITISIQAVRAALSNPVKNLRTE